MNHLKLSEINQESLSSDIFVYLVKNLPSLLMEKHGVFLPFDLADKSGNKTYNIIRRQYIAKGMWLQYKLLNSQDAAPELVLTKAKYYKPLAELTMAQMELAQEVYLIDEDSQIQDLFPLKWALLMEIYDCESILKQYWYFEKPSEIQGKEKDRLITNKYYNHLAKTDFRKIKNEPTILPPRLALETKGYCIGAVNPKFNREVFQPYIKKMKQIHRRIRICPYLTKMGVGRDGEIIPLTQRHQILL